MLLKKLRIVAIGMLLIAVALKKMSSNSDCCKFNDVHKFNKTLAYIFLSQVHDLMFLMNIRN